MMMFLSIKLILCGMVFPSTLAFIQLSPTKIIQHSNKEQTSKIIRTPNKLSSSSSNVFENEYEKDNRVDTHIMESTTTRKDNRFDTKILIDSATSTKRKIAQVEKFARLPVWPVWNGVAIFFISRIFGNEIAAKVEDSIGGRVCPNFFRDGQTSPFIMLVHHRHSFAEFDLLRFFQKTFFPEGFPAHPHRGFTTVTYILKGGFLHRDSLGIKQSYGAETRHKGKHTQWLKTGGGMLHEEMFDSVSENFFKPADQELYQLWVNIPSKEKLKPPKIDLLGGEDETPCVRTNISGKITETIVIAGTYKGKSSAAPIESDLAILHVKLDPKTRWNYDTRHETVIIYVRRGSIQIEGTIVPTHHTAYLSSEGSTLDIISEDEDTDFLLLSGEPLGEPVSAQGSMVMNSEAEINVAYDDYQRGQMGMPWSEQLTDEEWLEHAKKYPSRFKKI